MRTMKTKLFMIACTTLLMAACSSNENTNNNATKNPETSELSGTINIDGSSTVYPITEAVAEEFKTVQPKVRVTVGSSGSGAGFKKFARGESDISDASRAIKDKEKEACTDNNIVFYEATVALDGIAIVVNPANDWVNDITVEELKKMWQPESTVKLWSDIRPEWPTEEIHLYGPNTAHGTYDFFTEEIMGESGASRPDYNAVSDYNVAVQGISTDKDALGYFGLAYYEENKNKLKLVGVDNGKGPIMPSLETVKSGEYAPLSRPLFIYINKFAATRPEVKKFVSFYLENAGQLSKEVGYIPLPDVEYKKQVKEFNAFAE